MTIDQKESDSIIDEKTYNKNISTDIVLKTKISKLKDLKHLKKNYFRKRCIRIPLI